MALVPRLLTQTFDRFVRSEQASSMLLIVCTLLALALTNAPTGSAYLAFWQIRLGGLSLEHWVNDALMAVFFLLIGLELERELYVGELSEPKQALLPIVAAAGGMIAPALIHYSLNSGLPSQRGFGIPMATDIAFVLGVLALLGRRVPAALKVFVVAFAVMDDLGAIAIIAMFYTAKISGAYLLAATAVWAALIVFNRHFRIVALAPYLIGGALLWFCMLKSGVHATIAGVLLAFAIPFEAQQGASPSHRLEHALHRPVAFIVLPIFALANAGILVGEGWLLDLASMNSVGIAGGLLVGKPLGVALACMLAVSLGVCRLPSELNWSHVIGAGMLGGIGFTMSVFITNLAFGTDANLVNASKLSIVLASAAAGVLAYVWLRIAGRTTDRVE